MGRKRGAEPAVYRIEVEGWLDADWSEWIEGVTVAQECRPDGSPVTCFTCRVADQSALRGLLTRLWDLNLTLVSAVRIAGGTGNGSRRTAPMASCD